MIQRHKIFYSLDANGDSIKFDNVKPEASKMKIEFSELNLIQKVGEMLGFYKPDITITFTAPFSNALIKPDCSATPTPSIATNTITRGA